MDVYGNILPTPTWPPSQDLYEPNTMTVWFNQSVINQQFLCDYWYNYYHPSKTKDPNNKFDRLLVFNGVGHFPLTSDLITDPTVLNYLNNLGVEDLYQYSMLSPCEDAVSCSRCGNTFPTPHFWNCFYITMTTNQVADAVYNLNYAFGGTKIDFAELNSIKILDASPNDDKFNNGFTYGSQTNYKNDEIYEENIVGAWDQQHGQRNIKVAVVDNGIDYMHEDFGSGIGSGYRVVNGHEYNNGNFIQNPSNGGDHGTSCAGIIGAMTNNSLDVASIAGGWNTNEGISLYDMKIGGYFLTSGVINGWIDAVAQTTGGRGFGVHEISNSNGTYYYSEIWRRVLDYAYRSCVTCFSSKGNDNQLIIRYPADYENNKIIAVGSYGVINQSWNYQENYPWVPTRGREAGSNYGYGLDIMAHGDNTNPTILVNQTLQDGGGTVWFSRTSAATPQVAGVGALILSQFTQSPTNRFWNYENNTQLTWLAPEDVEGLLCIAANDLHYQYTSGGSSDSVGYDTETGYGMLRGGETLQNMLAPNNLYHYSATGGTVVGSAVIVPNFVVLASYDGSTPILPPTSATTYYSALRHTVHKTVDISNLGFITARSWGRGGDGTVGWSGVQPSDPSMNSSACQTGYCRVVGDAPSGLSNFNYNNTRSISYKNDVLTLETYCYEVYKKSNGNQYLGWFPTTPENAVFRYTVWGAATTDVFENNPTNEPDKITINCITGSILGQKSVQINYNMPKPGPSQLTIYDNMGRVIYLKNRDFWSDGNQTVTIPMDNIVDGVYFVVIKTNSNFGTASFVLIN